MTRPPGDPDEHPTEMFDRPTQQMIAKDAARGTSPEIPAATEPPTARRPRLLPSSWPATIGRAQTSTVVLVVLFVLLFGLYVWLRPVNTAGEVNPSRQPAVTEPSETPSDPTPTTTNEPSPTGTDEAPTSTVPPTETAPSTTPSETSTPTRSPEPQPSSESEPGPGSEPGTKDDDNAPARTTAPGPDSIERAPAATFELPG